MIALKNIYAEHELDESATTEEFSVVQFNFDNYIKQLLVDENKSGKISKAKDE